MRPPTDLRDPAYKRLRNVAVVALALAGVLVAPAAAGAWHACDDLAETGAAGGVRVPKDNPFREEPEPRWQGPVTQIRAQAISCRDVHAQLRLWLTEDRFPPTWAGRPEMDSPPRWVCGLARRRMFDCLGPLEELGRPPERDPRFNFRLVRAPLRIMTWNVKAEFAMDSDTGALANQVTTIGQLRPDVLGLQESCVRQAQQLRRRLLIEYSLDYRIAYGSVARKPYCGTLGGAFGQMTLSRFPISRSRVHELPPSCADLPGPFCQNDQKRGALATTVALPGASVRVFNVHLASKGDGVTRQVNAVGRLARPHRTAIVLGDFNRKPHQIGYRLRPFRDAGPPGVETRPRVGRIDYIFLRGVRLLHSQLFQVHTSVSDHHALFADVRTGR